MFKSLWQNYEKKIRNNKNCTLINQQHIVNKYIHEQVVFINGPKVVVIGGGTGLSTMLRGLKKHTSNITAVVTVADDGGGSGSLRQDLGMIPPGDIRNCIVALANTEPIMQQLLQYRFIEGVLKGQCFGNLLLAAMNGISTSFEEAVKKVSDVLAVTGRVLPVTLEDVKLCAKLKNGITICGESKIGEQKKNYGSTIEKVYLMPEQVSPLSDVLDAILEADVVIIGPGSLYTSIMPNLLVKGVNQAIQNSEAFKIHVCNVMTQPGETEGYSAYDHVLAMQQHAHIKPFIDACIVNKQPIPQELLHRYNEDGAQPVHIDKTLFEKNNILLIENNILSVKDGYIRHNTDKLAQVIMGLVKKHNL